MKTTNENVLVCSEIPDSIFLEIDLGIHAKLVFSSIRIHNTILCTAYYCQAQFFVTYGS